MDEQAWKRARPVLATTLIPLAAAGGFFALATYAKRSPSVADRPSMAAFDACLTNNGLQPQASYASQFDAQVAAQQEWKTCGSKIPQGVLDRWRRQADARQESFRNCVDTLAGPRTRGFGRFGGGRRDFRNAFAACRKLLQGTGTQTPPVKKPVAPVA